VRQRGAHVRHRAHLALRLQPPCLLPHFHRQGALYLRVRG
jgi:hypothetical protein